MKTSNFILSILIFSLLSTGCSSSKNTSKKDKTYTENSLTKSEETPKTQEATEDVPLETTTKIDDREEQLKKTIENYPDSLVALLKRTSCYGKCPVYTLKIYASGYVTYMGKNFTDKEGMHSGKISRENISRILKKAEEIKFFEFNNIYDSNVTDLPATYIYVNTNGTKKQIINRHGGPKELKEFAAYIDELVKGLKWKKIDSSN
ncbi:MAG: hypothetical protein JKY53_07065 [Flavobacteriales bacterium]|nr:hypothetical protein [Flavobacteriales bacterium]